MAITIECPTDKSITLEEYREFIAKLDVSDTDNVLASAEKLKQLSNNKNFLVEKINQELANLENFQQANFYSAQTLELGKGHNCFVRANMWFPRSGNPDEIEWENNLFAYDLPHDHNFSFLTVGHCGSGYATNIYEYDATNITGYPGEKVAISFLERTTLPEGKIMFYRASKDIHSQEESIDFSISLNLMVVSPELATRNQYWFDLESGSIRSYIQNPGSGRVMLCKLAKYIHNQRTSELLEMLSQHYIHSRIRGMAYDALASLHTSDAEFIWKRALQDTDRYVKHHAIKALDELSQDLSKKK